MKAALAALCLLPVRALASTSEFPLWDRLGATSAMSSADGYHYAEIHLSAETETLAVDGRVVARGPAGTLCRNGCPLAMSDDGRVVVHQLGRKVDGAFVYSPAIGGKALRGDYLGIDDARVSPKGRNAVWAVTTKGGHALLSSAGLGPVFRDRPSRPAVGEDGLLYVAEWDRARWLYRDNAPVDAKRRYRSVFAPPDLSVVATTYREDALDGVVLGGRRLGAWAIVAEESFDAMKRFLFVARTDPRSTTYDAVVVDGVVTPAVSPHYPSGSPAGPVYWLSSEGKGGQAVYRGGVRLGAWPIVAAPGWVSFSPVGSRWAALVAGGRGVNLLVDGRIVAEDLPDPIGPTFLVFDSETELHYLGSRGATDKVTLICASLGDKPSAKTDCGGRAAMASPKAAR